MSANRSQNCILVFEDSSSTQNTQTIAVTDIAPQGISVRKVQVQVIVNNAAGTVAIQKVASDDTVTTLLSSATFGATTVGNFDMELTSTYADLLLGTTDRLRYVRGGANIQCRICVEYGDPSPSSVTVTVS